MIVSTTMATASSLAARAAVRNVVVFFIVIVVFTALPWRSLGFSAAILVRIGAAAKFIFLF